jgi:hypothetical protein
VWRSNVKELSLFFSDECDNCYFYCDMLLPVPHKLQDKNTIKIIYIPTNIEFIILCLCMLYAARCLESINNAARWQRFHFTSAATIRKFLEVFLIWVTKI